MRNPLIEDKSIAVHKGFSIIHGGSAKSFFDDFLFYLPYLFVVPFLFLTKKMLDKPFVVFLKNADFLISLSRMDKFLSFVKRINKLTYSCLIVVIMILFIYLLKPAA